MMKMVANDRSTRIIHKFSEAQKARYPKDRPLKDKIYYARTRQEVMDLFDNMIINFGETLTLQTLVDVNDDGNPQWINQEEKTKNKNKPKVAFQFEHTPVANPK